VSRGRVRADEIQPQKSTDLGAGRRGWPGSDGFARWDDDLPGDLPYDEFKFRALWSLSNAFTCAFEELEPIPQFKATAKLGGLRAAAAYACRHRVWRISSPPATWGHGEHKFSALPSWNW
jgi:hypothetical protein